MIIPMMFRTPITVPFFCFPIVEGKMNWIESSTRKATMKISIIRMIIIPFQMVRIELRELLTQSPISEYLQNSKEIL